MSDEQNKVQQPRVRYQTKERASRSEEGETSRVEAAQYVVDRAGKKLAVILPLEQYRQMRKDLHDLAVVAERRDEEPIDLEEMKRRLRQDGLLSPGVSANV